MLGGVSPFFLIKSFEFEFVLMFIFSSPILVEIVKSSLPYVEKENS
jgi:hypothetical protein